MAAIPEQSTGSTVAAAKQALKPEKVVQEEQSVRRKLRNRRINKVRVRQGEWFFVPACLAHIDPVRIHKNEPLRRGGGKPHVCQELYRGGGIMVYVSRHESNGLTQAEFAAYVRTDFDKWRRVAREANIVIE